MRGRLDLNPDKVPPPELVLEIEVNRSMLARISIYEKFGVPEIWRCDGHSLTVCRLIDGKYQTSATSVAFPFLRPALLMDLLATHLNLVEIALAREFRKWVREQISAGWPRN